MDEMHFIKLLDSMQNIEKSLATLAEAAEARKQFYEDYSKKIDQFEIVLNKFTNDPFGLDERNE